jgi:hypothetical protein
MSQYFLNDKNQWATRVEGDISLKESQIIQPVDVQARYGQTIQTHNAVSVGANGTSDSVWIDCGGFDKLAITLLNDANAESLMFASWSNDGINTHGYETVGAKSVIKQNQGEVPVKARYVKVRIQNYDATVSHTMSAWAYLKA